MQQREFPCDFVNSTGQVIERDVVSVPLGAVYAETIKKAILHDIHDYYPKHAFVGGPTLYKDRAAYDEHKAIDPHDLLSVIFPTDPTEPLILAVPIDGWVTTNLDDVDQFTEECALTDWEAGSVHKIPLISSFLKDLGGCTKHGEIYWRLEDRLLVSFLIKCWFQESQWQEQFMEYDNRRALVVGSPGMGKSVITCVLAFYIALVRKTSVVVYRKVKDKGNCLFYLGYQDQEDTPGGSTQTKAVCFKATKCSMTSASIIYESLGNKCGKQKVWLFLDGFIFHDVPAELDDFKMLATSQQVDLKSDAVETTHYGLLSSWKKEDLFALGRSICGFSDDEMENRYYYSGGSVREFTLESVSDIRNTIDNAIAGVSESDELLSRKRFIHSHVSQIDRFRRTFVKMEKNDKYRIAGDEEIEEKKEVGRELEVREEKRGFESLTTRADWEQVVDSVYALQRLTNTYSKEKLFQFYTWAVNANHRSVAGGIFEIYLHRLAGDRKLKIFVSDYYMKDFRQPNQEPSYNFQQLTILDGSATRSVTKALEYEKDLVMWREDGSSTYWSPDCHEFHNIDSIMKLEPSANKKSAVAYLQITIAETHQIDFKKLMDMNKIFYDQNCDVPIYVALCEDEEACKKLVLKPRNQVVAAQEICRVCVGYCATSLTTTGSRNAVPPKAKRSPSPYETRSTKKQKTECVGVPHPAQAAVTRSTSVRGENDGHPQSTQGTGSQSTVESNTNLQDEIDSLKKQLADMAAECNHYREEATFLHPNEVIDRIRTSFWHHGDLNILLPAIDPRTNVVGNSTYLHLSVTRPE